MNKKSLLFTATLGLAYLAFSSYSAGPGGSGLNRTGSAGSTANCAGSGCHASNTTNTIVNFVIEDTLTGLKVNITGGKYIPNRSYEVTLNGFNTASSSTKFGFQATVTDIASVNAGTLLVLDAANTVVRTSPVLVEHKNVITGGSLSTLNGKFYWKAPAKGTGMVRFYGTFNLVNGNGNEGGDQPNNVTRDLDEDLTAGINEVAANIATRVFPNPCINTLNIEATNNTTFTATIFEIGGRQILTSQENKIDISSLTSGFYFLQLSNESGIQTVPFVKQ